MIPADNISIRPYSERDKWVLEKILSDPTQMVYLNGPESPEKLSKRHEEYLAMSADPHSGCMYTITAGSGANPVGNVGYWEAEWNGQKGWETGWFVLPQFQGKGIANSAMRLLINHLALFGPRFLFAFPSVNNLPSNAICKKLGFSLIEETELEYPSKSGLKLHSNVWRLEL